MFARKSIILPGTENTEISAHVFEDASVQLHLEHRMQDSFYQLPMHAEEFLELCDALQKIAELPEFEAIRLQCAVKSEGLRG